MQLRKRLKIKLFEEQSTDVAVETDKLRFAADSISSSAFELAGELTAHKVGRLVEMAVELEELDVMLKRRRMRLLN